MRRTTTHATAVSLAALIAAPGLAVAQDTGRDGAGDLNRDQARTLERGAEGTGDRSTGDAADRGAGDLDPEVLYASGISGEALLDADVYGSDGVEMTEEIGEVETVLVGPDGRIRAVIVEVGGFLDIGDTHVAVPWDQVDFVAGDAVSVPLDEERMENYGGLYDAETTLFTLQSALEAPVPGFDDVATGARIWRLEELIDDYAVLGSGAGWGFVDDVVIGEDGAILSVVVEPDVSYGVGGPYAYPFMGYEVGWHPGYDYFQIPGDAPRGDDLAVFEADRLRGGWD